MDYATEILKDPTYQSIVAEIEALEADRIYCRHGMAHIMDVCRLSWNLCLEDICLLQENLPMHIKKIDCKNETDVRLREKIDQNDLTVEFMETLRDRMFVVGLLHDIGRGAQYKTGEHHARAGARLADEILSRLQYPQEWKEQTVEIIHDHCGRKSKISKADAWSFLKQDATDELYHRFYQNLTSGVNHPDASESTMWESSADDKNADCEQNPGNVGRLIAYYIQLADHLSRLCFCCNAADTCKWAEDEKNQRFV